MKTMYINGMICAAGSSLTDIRKNYLEKYKVGDYILVIGVRDTPGSGVDVLLEMYPEFELVKTFPGVDNTNYLYGNDRKSHHLIPSIIRRIK